MKKFTGVYTALITPFRDSEVDFSSLERLVELQVKANIQGLVINGTTAESPNLSDKERQEIFKFVKKLVPHNFPLIMGTGSNSTYESIEKTKEAADLGADAALVVVPYYNKPPQRGLIQHFKSIASATKLPNILYNVPSRTITALELESIHELSQHPNIIGIKEASGDIQFAKKIREVCRKDFTLLSGDDVSYHEFLKADGDGVISVASHILPKFFAELRASSNEVDFNKYLEIIKNMGLETNPIPVKMALYLMGIIDTPDLRLPLAVATEHTKEILLKNLSKINLVG